MCVLPFHFVCCLELLEDSLLNFNFFTAVIVVVQLTSVGTAAAFELDVTKSESIRDILTAVSRHFGGITTLVNNAGKKRSLQFVPLSLPYTHTHTHTRTLSLSRSLSVCVCVSRCFCFLVFWGDVSVSVLANGCMLCTCFRF